MTAFGKTAGEIPVFLRSDTNMEDLKDFTGAGLNLTIFNAVKKEAILQGIKDVWASPYTERSFRWRQRYLLNPENVFPSILIIPSVDVDYSGVLITKGISTHDPRDITVAFSRGAGGAVDGQAAETYVLNHDGNNQLLSPAREPQYRRLPATGGTDNHLASFENRILSAHNLYALRSISQSIKKEMPTKMNVSSDAPLDVELGFKDDKIWLFQIRPFVENKNALSLAYLEKITPNLDNSKIINMTSKLL
jgi:phosphoenolpyruvate synthase/pyruvate phosphate dikinase